MWLSGKVPRDAFFALAVMEIADMYTRDLGDDEIVLSVDEKTNLQPRPRQAPTKPARPDEPTRLEHEYRRDGAPNLFVAFNTRSGEVSANTFGRKRQGEFIEFLEQIETTTPEEIRKIHLILDNVSVHKGKRVRKWLEKHPRMEFHHPPVHCSWMNQVEQWFGNLARKRLRIVDFPSKEALGVAMMEFVAEWNERAHPFRWTYASFEKILKKCDRVPEIGVAAAQGIVMETEKTGAPSSSIVERAPTELPLAA
ncbi:MAG TPA: IS630 family transposase [Armatimonadota bacterium]|nr:IS630 family transposase [Armatimonadota bacterium]